MKKVLRIIKGENLGYHDIEGLEILSVYKGDNIVYKENLYNVLYVEHNLDNKTTYIVVS